MKYFVTGFAAVLWSLTGCAKTAPTIYDPDPNHLWNQLNEALFVRTAEDGTKYGPDELDILYWHRTTNLLAGASHQRSVTSLAHPIPPANDNDLIELSQVV